LEEELNSFLTGIASSAHNEYLLIVLAELLYLSSVLLHGTQGNVNRRWNIDNIILKRRSDIYQSIFVSWGL